jgi:hypothetical protein
MPVFPVRPEVLRLRPYVPGRPIGDVQQQYGLADVVKLASCIYTPRGAPGRCARH